MSKKYGSGSSLFASPTETLGPGTTFLFETGSGPILATPEENFHSICQFDILWVLLIRFRFPFLFYFVGFFIVNMFEYSSNLFQYLLVFVFWFGVCFSIYTVDIKPKSNIYTTCTAQIFQRLAAVFFCERKGKQKAKPNKTTSNKLQLFRLCSIYSSSRGRLQIEWKIIRRKRVNRKRIHLAFFCSKRRMMR